MEAELEAAGGGRLGLTDTSKPGRLVLAERQGPGPEGRADEVQRRPPKKYSDDEGRARESMDARDLLQPLVVGRDDREGRAGVSPITRVPRRTLRRLVFRRFDVSP